MHRVISLEQPEGGAEHGLVFVRRHGCAMSRALKAELGDDAPTDEVIWPVGQTGYGVPGGIPFEVQSVGPCECCGAYLRAMFEWRKKLYLHGH